MKQIAAPILLLITILLYVIATKPVSSEPGADSYQWVRAIDTGVKTWPRWVMPIVGGDHKLHMIADGATFSSSDGVEWSNVKNGAGQVVRPGVARIFFNGKYWLMGGMNNWAEFTNEVWSSTDAVVWNRVTEHAPWGARRNALLVEFDNKLWLMGGAVSSGKRDQTPTQFYPDVWQSTDGVEWKQISTDMPASDEQIVVFNNQMWLLGKAGAFSSTDGKSWQRTATQLFSRLGGYGAAVYDGKMWIFGGLAPEKTTNQVWFSPDGITWREAQRAPWFPRGGEYSTVFNGKLWIYGGKTGTTYDKADDVWFMSAKS